MKCVSTEVLIFLLWQVSVKNLKTVFAFTGSVCINYPKTVSDYALGQASMDSLKIEFLIFAFCQIFVRNVMSHFLIFFSARFQ